MTLSVQSTSELFKTLPVLLPVFRLTTSEPVCGQGSQNEFPKSLQTRASRISSNSLLFNYFKKPIYQNRLYPVTSGYYFKYEHCYLKSIIYFRVPNSTSQLVQNTNKKPILSNHHYLTKISLQAVILVMIKMIYEKMREMTLRQGLKQISVCNTF